MRWPGIEPGSNAWKASMLTITPPTLIIRSPENILYTLRPRQNSPYQLWGREDMEFSYFYLCKIFL